MTDREQELTDTVLASFAGTPDPRLRELVTALNRHLHAFAREVRLTEDEWAAAIGFLTDAGHLTDDKRQEFILLSDVLGLSMQTITINHPAAGEVTESTVLGPFFVAGSPPGEQGGDVAFGAPGEPCWVTGSVRDEAGAPVAGALLEIWEADDDGFYDVQYGDSRTAARGHLRTGADGSYRFWALTPTPYPIPSDGPVGELLAATGRSPMRAPHLHFLVTAPGFRTLVTHIFVEGAALDGDSVFGVRDSLVKPFVRSDGPTPDGRELAGSWTRVRFDIVLARS
ncbi:MAG TPA: intradiol ring-cleavage dioxygenase [Mycobacteriales bacterium]|nr:intradiol ring-cleavage dioxygenase [Mycobacteriales bacterium]